MADYNNIDNNRLQYLLNMAKLGWWKADFYNKTYLCSEYIINLLNLESDTISFYEFGDLIREDYRVRISDEFAAIRNQDIYEQVFPITTRYGETWIHSKLGQKEMDAEGHLIAWGFLQCTEPLSISEEKELNGALYQQNSITRSLLSFLKTENIQEGINKILENILNYFHCSRAYIYEYDRINFQQICTYESVAKGMSGEKVHQNYCMSYTPWWTKQITAYSSIVFSDPEELPAEAANEKEILKKRNIHSGMTVPLIAQDYVWGYMGIDVSSESRIWSNQDYLWFSGIGNLISICMELHRSRNKAQKEREHFQSIYEHMPIGYVQLKLLHDANGVPSDCLFMDMNPGCGEITGIKTADFIGKTARELGQWDNITQNTNFLDCINTPKSYRQINYYINNKYLRTILYSLEDNEIIALFSDNTDTITAHRALDQSEKTLRNIYKNIPVGIEIYNQDGLFLDMNDKDVELFGVKDKSTVLGKINLFENPLVSDDVKQQIREHKDVDFPMKYNFSHLKGYYNTHQDGVKDLIVRCRSLYDANNEFQNYLLIVIDNTEQLFARNKILEFEEAFSVIADFAKIGFIRWNAATKTGYAISQWYKNWNEPEGRPLQKIVGQYSNIHPEDREKIFPFYEHLAVGKPAPVKAEVRIDNGQGGWRWLRCYIIARKYEPENNIIEVIGVNLDITELKETEDKLTEAKNRAETLDKLKSAFLANMSHEIRTPLNAIVGFSNLLTEASDPEEQHQYINIIQENNDLLLQLISDILDLSKIEAGTFEINNGDVDINMLCQEIVRSLGMKTAEAVILSCEIPLPECRIYSDRKRILQIITNFINNAIKFTTSGYIRLSYQIIGDMIEFSVTDTGIGISQKNLNSIFERFVKLNSFIHGTGLGLSICKSLTEQMGGDIGVESEEGKGSRFWFTLPYIRQEQPQQKKKTENQAGEVAVRRKERPVILVAEDNESNFVLVSTILKKDYTIQWARNGHEAVDMYRRQKPDLILMDIRMPEMDGLEATRIIRETDKDIPIIALTAFAFDSDRNRTLEAGCNDYITKPVQAQLLKNAIQKLL